MQVYSRVMETKVNNPQHGTRLRLATPGNPAPPTGRSAEGREPRIPGIHPRRRAEGRWGFRADLQQPGRRNPPPGKYLGCQGIENPGFPSPDPQGSISSMEKRHAPFYSEETELPFLSPFHPVMQEDRAHLRHPYRWGNMNRVAAGPTGTKHPHRPTFAYNPNCLGRLA